MYYTNTRVTLMYAAIDGFRELASNDPDTAHRVLEQFMDSMRECTRSEKGVVVQFGNGTGLSTFRTADAAFACSLKLDGELREKLEIPIMIGLNCGPVVLSESNVSGPVVRVASGLHPGSNAGPIVLASCVRDELCEEYSAMLSHAGMVEFREMNKEVEVYALRRRLSGKSFLRSVMSIFRKGMHNPESRGGARGATTVLGALLGLLYPMSQLLFQFQAPGCAVLP